MTPSQQHWIPAFGLLAAAALGTVALTLDRGDPANLAADASAQPPASAPIAAVHPIEVLTRPAAIREAAAIEAAAPRPVGVLTYLDGEGSYVAVNASDLASHLEVTEPASAIAGPTSTGDRYPSPDGRYEAIVRRVELGTWIDVFDRGTPVFSDGIAGPDDQTLVAGTKALAAAVDGIPLTIAWSPDSRYLAYGSITGAPYALALVRTDNWSSSYNRVAGGYVGELAWAPDSSRLAISTYEPDRSNHTVLIYNPQQPVPRRLIDGCRIVWAPDARFIAVHREPGDETGVWISSPDGKTRIEATADPNAFPISWTVTAS
ncbi:MAG: hypothetical protein O3A10_05595 [Chloroflexi bacterium]|nr:hypothetical protein [Chloroflexota bacterium]MDA1146152.1 hypothetical protein [Chloroflexota bacterium]